LTWGGANERRRLSIRQQRREARPWHMGADPEESSRFEIIPIESSSTSGSCSSANASIAGWMQKSCFGSSMCPPPHALPREPRRTERATCIARTSGEPAPRGGTKSESARTRCAWRGAARSVGRGVQPALLPGEWVRRVAFAAASHRAESGVPSRKCRVEARGKAAAPRKAPRLGKPAKGALTASVTRIQARDCALVVNTGRLDRPWW
jgi:hypothetical protein